jgi:hypothetical protein
MATDEQGFHFSTVCMAIILERANLVFFASRISLTFDGRMLQCDLAAAFH